MANFFLDVLQGDFFRLRDGLGFFGGGPVFLIGLGFFLFLLLLPGFLFQFLFFDHFRGDVAAVAKRDLRAGEMLDGEGGYTVWGKLMPAAASLAAGALPIGLAHKVKLRSDIAHGAVVRWSDVETDAGDETIRTRRAMEAKFGGVG